MPNENVSSRFDDEKPKSVNVFYDFIDKKNRSVNDSSPKKRSYDDSCSIHSRIICSIHRSSSLITGTKNNIHQALTTFQLLDKKSSTSNELSVSRPIHSQLPGIITSTIDL